MKPLLRFTKVDLQELATDGSFYKGKDYYLSGAVKKILYRNNHFEGKVHGSERYEVTLDINDDSLDFTCDCPYDYDGICKHCVAFGLAVLNGEFAEIDELDSASEEYSFENFDQCFDKTDTQKKLSFLKQLLDKDANLKAQFVAFVQPEKPSTDESYDNEIDEMAADINEDLSDLDFDEAMESSHEYSSGYDDEGEVDEAYELITDVLEPYFDDAIKNVKKGNLLDGFVYILSIYEGTQNLDEPSDNYNIFYDGYDKKVGEFVDEYFIKFAVELEQIVKSDENIKSVIDLFFERYDKIQNTDVADEAPEIIYDVKRFEPIFLPLLANAELAQYLYIKIQEFDLECLGFSFVILKIADLTDNQTLWFETVESFAELDASLTKILLEKYNETNQKDNFNRIAAMAFKNWASQFDSYLIDNLDKENQRDLLIAALKNHINQDYKIKNYKELRLYLDDNQKNEYIEEIRKSGYTSFYVEVLEVEKRYDEILNLVKAKCNDSELDKLIKPILTIYPEDSFNILQKRIEKELNSTGRNRHTYQYMVKLMLLMQTIAKQRTEITQFFKSIYSNRLPALKDEMQQAKLI